MNLLLNEQFWKILGTIAGPILAIVSGVVYIMKMRINNDVKIIEEKYKTKMQEKVHAVNKVVQDISSEVRDVITQQKSEMNILKQEVEFKLSSNTKDLEYFFEKYEKNLKTMTGNFTDQLEDISEEITTVNDSLSKRLLNMESSIETVAEKFNEIEVAKLAKKEFVDQLNRILKNAITYMPTPLQPFAILKGSNFIDFVMQIRAMDFSTIDASLVKLKGEAGSEEVYREGVKLLGEKFMKEYYINHSKRVSGFLERVVYIITDQEHDKKFSFQTVCLTFLESFLRMLCVCYQENRHLVKTKEDNPQE